MVQNPNGYHILVIYDSSTGGTPGSVQVAITGSGGQLVFSDSPDEARGFSSTGVMQHTWPAANTDGYALGPYLSATQVCFNFGPIFNLDNGARFVNGNGLITSLASSGAELASQPICVVTPAAPNSVSP